MAGNQEPSSLTNRMKVQISVAESDCLLLFVVLFCSMTVMGDISRHRWPHNYIDEFESSHTLPSYRSD